VDVNWIKITTNMFEDEKIDYIESLPEADTILMIWVRLLAMAGKSNMGGYILLTEKIPYTEEMLAHKFKRQLNTVKFALLTFAKLYMVIFDEAGIKIFNWDKHQNVQGLDKIREQNKIRKQRQRLVARQQRPAILPVGVDQTVTLSHVTVTEESRPPSIIDKELEIDINTNIVPDFPGTEIDRDHCESAELGSSTENLVGECIPPVGKDSDSVNSGSVGGDEEEGPKEQVAKEKYKYLPEHRQLAERLEHCMLENKPDRKRTSSIGQWANTIRLMIQRDDRSSKQIAAVIDWCQQDKFWKLNILSADTLREQFDRLELQMVESMKARQGAGRIQHKGESLSPQLAWEEVYQRLILNKEKGIQWSSAGIGQAVKRVGFTNLLQNGAVCRAQFIHEYSQVMRE
jgi:predicted phage replisome organizer